MSFSIRTDVKGIEAFHFSPGADAEKLRLHVSEVEPGQRSHAPHQHEGQEIFFVLKGQAEVIVGEQRTNVSAGEALQVDCRILHGIQNAGDENLRYAVIIAK